MPDRDPSEFTDDELVDAASHTNARLYPERAAAIDRELRTRNIKPPLFEVRCAAVIGWMQWDHPLAGLAIFEHHLELTAGTGKLTLIAAAIDAIDYERMILRRWIHIRHHDPNVPELTIRTRDDQKTLAALRRLIPS